MTESPRLSLYKKNEIRVRGTQVTRRASTGNAIAHTNAAILLCPAIGPRIMPDAAAVTPTCRQETSITTLYHNLTSRMQLSFVLR